MNCCAHDQAHVLRGWTAFTHKNTLLSTGLSSYLWMSVFVPSSRHSTIASNEWILQWPPVPKVPTTMFPRLFQSSTIALDELYKSPNPGISAWHHTVASALLVA